MGRVKTEGEKFVEAMEEFETLVEPNFNVMCDCEICKAALESDGIWWVWGLDD